MVALRGIVSFVVIMFCTDLFCAVESDSQGLITIPESEHFCAKVMSGRFEHIQLVSIRPDAIFEHNGRVLPVTARGELSMTLKDTYRTVQTRDELVTSETSEFTLLYKFENDTATGYVIQKDYQTGNFIIHDFVYKGNGSDSSNSPYQKEPIPNDAFYFMEKTNNRFGFRLLHRDQANGSSSDDRQLLRGALSPSGFLHADLVYLFDGSLGCVHILDQFNLTQLFKAGKVDIRMARLGIPYELYFRCPDKYKLACNFTKRYRVDRCFSVIGDDDGSPPVDNAGDLFCALVVFLLLAALVLGGLSLVPERVNMSHEENNRLMWSKTLTNSGSTSSGTPTFEITSSDDASA